MRRSLPLLALLVLLLTSSAAATRYTLRRGDTLGGVARRLGVSVDAPARANRIKNRNRGPAGRVLVVPAKTAKQSKAGKATASPPMKAAVATKPAGKTSSAPAPIA